MKSDIGIDVEHTNLLVICSNRDDTDICWTPCVTAGAALAEEVNNVLFCTFCFLFVFLTRVTNLWDSLKRLIPYNTSGFIHFIKWRQKGVMWQPTLDVSHDDITAFNPSDKRYRNSPLTCDKETCIPALSQTNTNTQPSPCDENPLTHHKINIWGSNTGLSVCELKDIRGCLSHPV